MCLFLRSTVLVLLLAGAMPGQRYSFKVYGQDAGLTNLDVHCLMQDRTGFLWAGTAEGLARLHGDTFETVQSGPGYAAHAIASDARGNLYVGTSRGLLVAPPGGPPGKREFRLHAVAGESQGPQQVFGIAVESPGRVWYGCAQEI